LAKLHSYRQKRHVDQNVSVQFASANIYNLFYTLVLFNIKRKSMFRARLTLLIFAFLVGGVVGCKKDDDVDTPPNKVPAVDAGLIKNITLPDSVVLKGSASDSDGHVVSYLWSEVSGPAAATIITPGSATTSVKFDTKGTYLFQLAATDDKGATGVDTVSVIVNPSVLKTVTLQPNNNPTEYYLVNNNGNDQSSVAFTSIEADAWTIGGNPVYLRALLKFDLSSIPATATIKSANLYLYSNPAPINGNTTDPNFGSSNAMLVQQVNTSWSTSGLTWFNQPSASTSNQVVVPQAPQGQLDINIDVTSQVASMVNNNANYGWLLRLQTETAYNSRQFVASHNSTYPDKHPKLVIYYQ
jgi:hypothetical protein